MELLFVNEDSRVRFGISNVEARWGRCSYKIKLLFPPLLLLPSRGCRLFVPEAVCVKAACSLSGSFSPSWWAAAWQSRRVALSGGGQLLIQLSSTLRSSERTSDLRDTGCIKMNGATQECDCVRLCRYYLTLGGGGGTSVLPCSKTCAHPPTFL